MKSSNIFILRENTKKEDMGLEISNKINQSTIAEIKKKIKF